MHKFSHQQMRLLPKIDLHRHLDCSMRWSTLLEVAKTLKLEIPQLAHKQASHFLVTEPMVNLEAVLNKFLIAQKLLASEEILERLAFECCEDAFNDGVRILELRYAPTFITSGHKNLSFEKIHSAFLKGLERAENQMLVATGLICIIQRTLNPSEADQVCQFAIENKESFLALDLADNEDGFEPKSFAPMFARAKKSGLHITVHSGEIPNDQAQNWIMDSIQILGAERIGHGIQAIHSTETLNFLIKQNIALEVCPHSNYLTQAFKTHAEHPLRKLYDLGVPITLNSDDPGMFASTLTDDYIIAQDYHNFSLTEFQKCNQTAFRKSFINQEKKERAWKI